MTVAEFGTWLVETRLTLALTDDGGYWVAAEDWWMMVNIWMAAESRWMVARCVSGGGGETNMQRTRNSKEVDAKTSNSTRRCRRRFNKQYTEKKMQQARTGCRMG